MGKFFTKIRHIR